MSKEEVLKSKLRKQFKTPSPYKDINDWALNEFISGLMQAHTNQALHELRDDIDRNVGSWDSDCRFNECKQQVLKLVESYYNK